MTENPSENDAIRKVETFIQRCHDLDYVFSPETIKLVVHKSEAYSDRIPWANVIADAMTTYTLNKGNPDNRLTAAEECLGLINKAFAAGIVKEGPGLINKHKEGQAKVVELSTKVDELTADNLFLKAKIDLMDS